MKKFLTRFHFTLLIGIIFFAFVVRIARIDQPERYIFDEVYHALTAKLITRNDPQAFEWWNPPVEPNTAVDWLHPPYAKYTQAFFIYLFGENSFGWRVSSVIFGVLVIVMVYKLSLELFSNRNLSLLATLLAAFDGLLLAQSRIAMNDIHVTFFILLTLFFYLRYQKQRHWSQLVLTGISVGLAMGSKWSGIFALGIVGLFEGQQSLSAAFQKGKLHLSQILLTIFSLIFLPIFLYVASYSQMFLQGKSLFCWSDHAISGQCYHETLALGPWKFEGYISHFAELHRQIWWYQTNLKATHPYQSRPIDWFFNLKPVWFHVEYQDDQLINIYAQGNSVLFWLGGIFVGVSLIVGAGKWLAKPLSKFFTHQKTLTTWKKIVWPKQLGFLLISYLMVWLPWQLSPRIMFFYHYTPAVPLLAIIVAYWLVRLSSTRWHKIPVGKILLIGAITACGLNFILFYPHWTGLPVSEQIFKPLYFALKSWK